MNPSLRKMVHLGLRILLGGVFLYAAAGKILHPADFAEAIYNYHILPDALINLAALVLPWLELFLGLMLVAGVWLPGALFLVNLLLAAFIAALSFNLARGLNIHCGCFTSAAGAAGSGAMVMTLVRDAGLLAAGLYLLWRLPRPGLSPESRAPQA